MGRKKQTVVAREERESALARRTLTIGALCDALAEKVGVALAATDATDTKELKQISSIIKEIAAVMGTSFEDESAERALRLSRLSRELSSDSEPRQLSVRFEREGEEFTV